MVPYIRWLPTGILIYTENCQVCMRGTMMHSASQAQMPPPYPRNSQWLGLGRPPWWLPLVNGQADFECSSGARLVKGCCNLQSVKNVTAITHELWYNPQKFTREAWSGQTACPSSHSKCRAQIANFLCNRQDSTYFKLYRPYILCHNLLDSVLLWKAATDNM